MRRTARNAGQYALCIVVFAMMKVIFAMMKMGVAKAPLTATKLNAPACYGLMA